MIIAVFGIATFLVGAEFEEVITSDSMLRDKDDGLRAPTKKVMRLPKYAKAYSECNYVNALQFYGSNFPQDCTTAAQSLDISELEVGEPTEIARFGEIFCNPRCGNSLISYSETCCHNEGQLFRKQLVQLCAQNCRFEHCYSAEVVFYLNMMSYYCDITSTYASGCCRSIQTAVGAVGCCVNVVDINTGRLEDTCNVDIPEPCSGSTINGAVASSVSISTGGFTVLLTISTSELIF